MKSLFKKAITAIMRAIARQALDAHHPRIVSITGSVGKTGTKEAIGAVLGKHHSVRKSEKSFNSEIGVPLSILALPNAWESIGGWLRNIMNGMNEVRSKDFPEWLVLEVGVDHPGDISRTASWLSSDIVLFTRFPDVPVHVEFFPSPEAVMDEKLQLLKSLKEDGTVIVNADDPKMDTITPAKGQQKISFGFSPSSTIKAESAAVAYENGKPCGTRIRVIAGGANNAITIPGALGDGPVYAALAALSVAHALNESIPDAISAIEAMEPSQGRMRIIEGTVGSCLIDDTYNASPAAAVSALATLGEVSATGKKIFALADMKELGEFAEAEHLKIGTRAARLFQEGKLQLFMTVGDLAAHASRSAAEGGMPIENIQTFSSQSDLAEHLKKIVGQGDVILLKGSQSMRMEKAVEDLMAHPEEASQLLVRQDEEWKKR